MERLKEQAQKKTNQTSPKDGAFWAECCLGQGRRMPQEMVCC